MANVTAVENNEIVKTTSIVVQLRQLGFVTIPNGEELAPIGGAILHVFPQHANTTALVVKGRQLGY
jgi:hypothetical protein